MMGIMGRAVGPLPSVTREDLVPPDHGYRRLEDTRDRRFVRDLVRDADAPSGQPSIDPVVFCMLHLVQLFEGLRSERQLMPVVADRFSLRVLPRRRAERAAARSLHPSPRPAPGGIAQRRERGGEPPGRHPRPGRGRRLHERPQKGRQAPRWQERWQAPRSQERWQAPRRQERRPLARGKTDTGKHAKRGR